MSIPAVYHDKHLTQTWSYCDKNGKPIGFVCRYQNGDGKKEIVPYFKPKGASWGAGIDLNPRPLFGLEQLEKQPKDKIIFVAEGEKSAMALRWMGLCAVTSLGGAQAAEKSDWSPLTEFRQVYLVPDNDEAGEHYMQTVYKALLKLEPPPFVRVLRLSCEAKGDDIVEWIQRFIEWDGYAPIPANSIAKLKTEFLAEFKHAEPVPNNWALATLATSMPTILRWEEPNKIETKSPPVHVFQSELMPKPLRGWLVDVSFRMQTPLDFSAVSAITIIASLIGAGCGIRPKSVDDWEVICNIWGACIGNPSAVLKSPSMKEPMGLLERIQAEYGEQFSLEKSGAEFDSLAIKAMLDDVKSQISKVAKGKGKDGVVDADELLKLKVDYMQINDETEPEATRRILKSNETSIQSMTVLQKQNPRGILVFRDELTALLTRWDGDEGADERAYFLEGWNGNGSYTDFKIGRGLTEAANICISLLGGIQPDKLKRYLYQALRGNNDGLMQRLQLAVWPDEPKTWKLIDTKPCKAEKRRAYDIMKLLAEIDFLQFGATQSEHDDRPYFRFSDDAQSIFNNWLTELQLIKIKQEENPLMCEHFGKFRSLMPSLALIFHCIDIADGKAQGNVSAQSAQLAVEWCKYLESHARRIYAMAESPEHEAAVKLSVKIKSLALPTPFSSKNVYDKHWHGLKDKVEVEAACEILIDENWLIMTRKPKPSTGRPPLPEYHINPAFL